MQWSDDRSLALITRSRGATFANCNIGTVRDVIVIRIRRSLSCIHLGSCFSPVMKPLFQGDHATGDRKLPRHRTLSFSSMRTMEMLILEFDLKPRTKSHSFSLEQAQWGNSRKWYLPVQTWKKELAGVTSDFIGFRLDLTYSRCSHACNADTWLSVILQAILLGLVASFEGALSLHVRGIDNIHSTMFLLRPVQRCWYLIM